MWLFCAAPALAQDAECNACENVFPLQDAVFWGTKSFCSDGCKDDFWAKYQDRQYRCKVCDEKVRDPNKPVEGDNAAVKWDGLCAPCRVNKARHGTKGGGISASSTIEHFPDAVVAAKPKRRVVLPAADIDTSGGVPLVSWLLIGVLGGLVFIRQTKRKQTTAASARGK